MPMLKNEVFPPGDWIAEVHVRAYDPKGPDTKWRWLRYNLPRHHIHAGVGYDFEFLAQNMKAARENARGTLRMRNKKTGDIIMVDIL